MAAWNSSALAFSDKGGKSSGIFKNSKDRISKQHIQEQRMFGSKRGKTGKDLQIGRKFKKGMSKSLAGDMKSSAISPSIDEFDKMMSKISGGSNPNSSNKKKLFNRKQFG